VVLAAGATKLDAISAGARVSPPKDLGATRSRELLNVSRHALAVRGHAHNRRSWLALCNGVTGQKRRAFSRVVVLYRKS
jgi:hypothetical protein